ncbi:MAG TPA: VTT domain-containing protein [Acidobacteriaceae bacterium]|nr:VTT domain-containing protein [Acidobacteriaceae bacterium]
MKRLVELSTKYRVLLLGFLKPLGFWGVGAVAVLDSSSIPVPMDLIVAGYAWSDPHRFYLYVLMAAIGSAIGGLVPYWLGRAGGEIFLMKRIDRTRYEKMRDRFERQEFLALMIPSMMPPPTPWKVFVFAAGVFEMKVASFMLAVLAGRIVRFTVVSLLTIRYGPQIVHDLTILMQQHMLAMLVALGVVLIVLAVLALRKGMSKRAPAV